METQRQPIAIPWSLIISFVCRVYSPPPSSRCVSITAATPARAGLLVLGKKGGGEKGKEMAGDTFELEGSSGERTLNVPRVTKVEPLLFKELLDHPGGRLGTGRGRSALRMGQAEEVRQK